MPNPVIGGRYSLAKKILTGDSSRGLPDLWEAHDGGDVFFVKLWKRKNGEIDTLQALWNREVRSLTRLQSYPSAKEFFVHLRDLGFTGKYFYVVIDGDLRILLSQVLANKAKFSWINNLTETSRRRSLWEGLQRIAGALSILHGEGTLHRSLSSDAVFVHQSGNGNFRLGGFEWSLRIAGSEGATATFAERHSVRAPELTKPSGEYSTATDWFDFGLVAAEMFGVVMTAARSPSSVRSSISNLSNLPMREREVLLALLEEDDEKRLSNGTDVIATIDCVVRGLSSSTLAQTRSLVVGLRISPDSEMSRLIDNASDGQASKDFPLQQLDWVSRDIRGDIRVIARPSPNPHYIIQGEKLRYKVRPWSIGDATTWEIGFCESVDTILNTNPDDKYFSTGERMIEVHLYPQARNNFTKIRDRSAQWDKVFAFPSTKIALPAFLRDMHDFFRITQQIDTILTAAQICPIDVIDLQTTSRDTTVTVTPREEPERNDLASFLGLDRPSEQIQDWFDLGAEIIIADDENDPKKDHYTILNRRTIGNEVDPREWKFVKAIQHSSGPRYQFRTLGTVTQAHSAAYLARNHAGSLAQIRRRYKAIEELRYHESLLKLLSNPNENIRLREDNLPQEKWQIELDFSKTNALNLMWKTYPFFSVQGPPGTGKTTLVQAFLEQMFFSDGSAQVLITAHSHHTVDDLLSKVAELFSSSDKSPILLRLGARGESEYGINNITSKLMEQLTNSEIFESAPIHIKDRMKKISAETGDGGIKKNIDLRTFELLVQDAANVVFSTSNSADLASILERQKRFDWSVIEEAGKAHGFDMAAALQSSHRILLIGDHYQLPPYNVNVYKKLLGKPLQVRKAMQTGAQFASGLVEPTLVDEEEDREPFEERCLKWRQMVTLFGNLFEKSISAGNVKCAVTLTDQHRMHPHIAELVGKIFYPNDNGGTILVSPEETVAKFSQDSPFTISEDSWLPRQAVVWCNVPWVQQEEFSEGETDGLFISPSEVDLVIKILEQIKPRENRRCNIQILSPYTNQIVAIKKEVHSARRRGQLEHMFYEPFDLLIEKRLGATVDEFQGSEADVVIVSLVRNNGLVPWKSVGFLKDATRMNVLLSRAKQKLIIVGSWEFFLTRCNDSTSPDDEHAYIGHMMTEMLKAKNLGNLALV